MAQEGEWDRAPFCSPGQNPGPGTAGVPKTLGWQPDGSSRGPAICRSFTIKTVGGDHMSGAEILDPVWERMVHWHAVEMIDANRETRRKELHRKIEAAGVAPSTIEKFERLAA